VQLVGHLYIHSVSYVSTVIFLKKKEKKKRPNRIENEASLLPKILLFVVTRISLLLQIIIKIILYLTDLSLYANERRVPKAGIFLHVEKKKS